MTKDYSKYVAEIIPSDLTDEMSANRQETLTDFGIAVMNGTKQGFTELSIDTNIASINTNTAKNNYDANGNQQVNLNRALNSAIDSIDINKMSSGGVITALSAITATTTSSEIDCRGFNSVRIEVETTALGTSSVWTPTITGSCVSGGTFGQIYQNVNGTQTAITLPTLSAVKKEVYIIQGGIPNFIKITETLTVSTGTVTVKVVPFNV